MMDLQDPSSQNITIESRDGSPITLSLADIQGFVHYNQQLCVNYAVQLGASIILFVMLLLLTRRRGSWVFALNFAALVLNIFRLLFQLIHFSTPVEDIYSYFASDYSDLSDSAYAVSVLAIVFETLLVICFEASLILQVQVVCLTLRRRYRYTLLALSVVVALIPISFRLVYMVANCMNVFSLSVWSLELIWLNKTTLICITVSICFFCLVFVTKLGFAIKQRRRLGVRDFGPMKIIFICGCQTLIIPALVTVIQFYVLLPEFGSNALTLVVISLPLSSIWAGASLDCIQRMDSERTRTPSRNLWQKLAFDSGTTLRDSTTLRSSSVATELSPAPKTFCYSKSSGKAAEKTSNDTQSLGITVERNISVSSVHQPEALV